MKGFGSAENLLGWSQNQESSPLRTQTQKILFWEICPRAAAPALLQRGALYLSEGTWDAVGMGLPPHRRHK